MRTATWAPGRARLLTLAAAASVLVTLLPAAALAAPPVGVPTLLSPTPGQVVSENPVLSWSSVTGAAEYRVQISTSAGFGALIYNVDTVNRKATPPTDLPLGTLYWRVAGTDGGSGIGTYASSSFVRQWGTAPTPTAPLGTVVTPAVLDFPTEPALFTWLPLAGAKSYTIEIDDADDFIGAQSFTTNNTSYTLTEPQTVDQTFYWRVRATSTNAGVVSEWSTVNAYRPDWPSAPTLQLPPDNPSPAIQDVVFQWAPFNGAATYQLQVSPNGDWTNNLTEDVTVKGTRFSPSDTYGNGTYYWRVRAKDAKSTPNNGDWSQERTFTRGWPDRPVEVTPAWTPGDPVPHIIGNPTFEWTPVPLASYYELQTSVDINFSPGDPTTSSCYTNHTTVTLYTTITGGGTPGGCGSDIDATGVVYYWRVRGIDGVTGTLGQWSQTSGPDTRRFLRNPFRPVQITPTIGDFAVETPVLTWYPVDNAEKYIVTIKNDDLTTNAVSPATTYGESYTPTSDLDPFDGPFHWYVQAVDGYGVKSAVPDSDEWWTFNVVAPTTTTLNLTPLTPADGSSSIRMPSLTWEPYTGATHYKVRYGVDGSGFVNGTPLSGSTNLPYAGFTNAALPLVPNTYFWYVEAYNGSTLLEEGPTSTFTILPIETLGAAGYFTPTKCTELLPCDAERDTPTLTWSYEPHAGTYEVTIAMDADFTNVVKQYKTPYTNLTPRESLVDNQAGQAFYWFVRPCIDFALSRCGPGSDDAAANDLASAFKKQSKAVEVLTPADTASVANQVTFTWADYLATNQTLPFVNNQEARKYRIEVSQAADFASIFDTATVDQTTYTPYNKTYPEGPLYWRVQAIDQTGNLLTKSAPRLVTKASPALVPTFPADLANVSGVPYFQWTPQAYAARYDIEVYENGDLLFSPANKVLTKQTKFAAWAPTTSLAAGEYAWRIRRLDADGRQGPWNTGIKFTLQPAAPALTAPANGATVDDTNLLFTWGAVAGAVQYRIELGQTCAFTPVIYPQTTVMTAWATTAIIPDGSYCWRVKVLDAAGNTLATSSTRTFNVGEPPPPPATETTFVPIDPLRVLDSRSGNGLSGQFSANVARDLQVAGRLGLPADIVAVTGNVTVVGQTAAGFISITPEPENNPQTSSINFPVGDIRANNVTTPLADDGGLGIVYKAVAGKKAHILFDVTGYFLDNNSGATYNAMAPVRLLDTRSGNGLSGKFLASTPRTWDIAGRDDVPDDAIAVTGNLTVVGQTGPGFVSLGPAADPTPDTSTINFPLGDIRANGLTVKLSGTGGLSATYGASAGQTTDLLFDVTGYYLQDLTGAKFIALEPGRVLDSRSGVGLSGKFNSSVARTLAVEGHVGVPASAVAITGNLTVVEQTAAGFVAMTQTAQNNPTTSSLNFPLGDIRANGVTGPLSGAGSVGLVYKATAGKSTHLVLDITGYFK